MAKITVVGAGVSGLTCALQLLKKGHSVTIVGHHIPGDIDIAYTSPFAGANWSSFATAEQKWDQDIDMQGYKVLMELARTNPNAGVHIVPHDKLVRPHELDDKGQMKFPWFAEKMENFRVLEKSEIPTDEFVGGFTYDTVTITTTIYIHWLLQQIYTLGGQLKRRELKHIDEAYALHHSGEKADLVVNCSGLGALKLGGVKDDKMFPIRGQILWVRNSASKQVTCTLPGDYKGESFYMFPRKEGGCIIGGTFLPNDWSSQPDPQLTKRMVQRAKKYAPELVDTAKGNPPEIEIFRENVGHRPARKGGVRVEREGRVIHNYGIAGAGYQASWGLAAEVCKMVDGALRESKL